jgi:hypothetical protein
VLFLSFLSFILSFTLRKRFIEVDYHPGDLEFIQFWGVKSWEIEWPFGSKHWVLKKHNDGSHTLVQNKC